jgi:hypothetical protein
MPNGQPSKYWQNNPTTLITELTPVTYQGQQPATRTHGRGSGTDNSNHTTRNARYYLDETFRLCGGVEGFTQWAKSHPNEFYPLYIKARVPRPLPQAEDENGEAGVTIIIQASSNSHATSTQITQANTQADEKQTA